MPYSNSQNELFSNYSSLNLKDKLYQVKAIHLAISYLKSDNKSIKILDIGCADGTFAQYAGIILKAKTYGIDISTRPVKKAKNILNEAIVHDVTFALPYPDRYFRIVFALEVIEHLFDTDFFLNEVRRVLVPGGILILSTPNLASLQNRLKLLFNIYPHYLEYSKEGAGHIHLYTTPVLAKQLKNNEFKVKVFTSPNFVAPCITSPKAPQIYRTIMMRLGDYFPSLGSHIMVVAQR
jgi:2-polyprenyl-3-methyl-5-hydroxy-6-metoxy-1,4-benzoquinol methylase